MGKVIQKIVVNTITNKSIYLIDVDEEKEIIKYRLSDESDKLIVSDYFIKDNMIQLDDFFFHINYIFNFKEMNNEG